VLLRVRALQTRRAADAARWLHARGLVFAMHGGALRRGGLVFARDAMRYTGCDALHGKQCAALWASLSAVMCGAMLLTMVSRVFNTFSTLRRVRLCKVDDFKR
jgi:hypothetical protein